MGSSSAFRILLVVGVRPQYIKAVALTKIIEEHNASSADKIELSIVDTGQHYHDRLLPEFLTPQTVLRTVRLPQTSQHPFRRFASAVSELGESLIASDDVDALMVIGDANPTMVGAIVGAKLSIPIVHVEAGVRRDPIEQEEKNRRVADVLASLRFCVSEGALKTLSAEGLPEGNVLTGDLWYSYLMKVAKESQFPLKHNQHEKGYILVTMHRPHNLDIPTLSALIDAVSRSGRSIRWITHPRIADNILQLCAGVSNISVEPPQGYHEMVESVLGSAYVITDSGGLIRESHHLRRRVLVRRDSGGWDELIEGGFNRRIGRTEEEIRLGIAWAERSSAEAYPSESPLRQANGTSAALKALLAFQTRL